MMTYTNDDAYKVILSMQGYGLLVIMGEDVQFTKKFAETLEHFIFQQQDLDRGIDMALIKHVELIDTQRHKEFCITIRHIMEKLDPNFESLKREGVIVD